MFLLKNKAPKEIVTTRFEIRIKPWSKIIQMLTVALQEICMLCKIFFILTVVIFIYLFSMIIQ